MLQTADVDAKIAAEDAETECLLVCGSLSCFAAAAALAAETTADANSKPVKLTRTGISARAIP